MEINEQDYILGVWYGEKPKLGNLLMTVKKQGDKWYSEARFRFYFDDVAFNSGDKKVFYSKEIEGTEQEVQNQINEEMNFAKERGVIDSIEYVEIKGDVHKLMFQMAMQPWTQIRKENNANTNQFETGRK